MNNYLKNILIFLGLLVINSSYSFAATITISSNYGLENMLLAFYLVCMAIVWFYIFTKTNPIKKIDEKRLLSSFINAVTRLVCYAWFFVIFYSFRAVLFVASASDFLESKLYLINLLYYVTFFFLGLALLLIFIKHQSEISGLSDFLGKVLYEVKNGE